MSVLLATSRGVSGTYSDGTIKVTLTFEPSDRMAVMELMGEPGASVAVARISPGAAKADTIKKAASPYGQEAKALRLSGFFRSPEVWVAVGTDDDYRAWLRLHDCISCGAPAPSEAAHVRSVADGAGTGIKPTYSAVPLCQKCHQIQHTGGIVAMTGAKDVTTAREQLQQERIRFVEEWAWEVSKHNFEDDSYSRIPPEEVLAWAEKHGIERYLPQEYRP
jgi:hypothetical protein